MVDNLTLIFYPPAAILRCLTIFVNGLVVERRANA
jgi:hypothetical protein